MINEKIRIVKLSAGNGKHRVHGIGIITEGGLIISISGGDHPHVGTVALGVPQPSLKDPKKLSATASVLTLVGHKDDEIAKPLSEKLARDSIKPRQLLQECT